MKLRASSNPRAAATRCSSFLKGNELRDLSVSRTSFDWGVPVPGSDGHVMYVWVDALTTYLTGIGFPEREGEFARFWPADLHLIGKDIVRFHAVYWPAFLKSAGLPLPKAIFGHGFLLHRGEKMSKSLGNVVDPLELAERFGVDQLRYFLLAEVPFGKDGGFSAEAIVTRCNAELANSFGNLAQRVLSMIFKNCDGELTAFETMPRTIPRCFAAVREVTGELIRGLRRARFLEPGSRRGCARCSRAMLTSTNRRRGRCARPIPSGCARCC